MSSQPDSSGANAMEEILSDFDNVQWCQDILNHHNFKPLKSKGRCPPEPFDKFIPNTLLAESLKTEKTIRAFVNLISKETRPGNASPDLILLLSLGTGLEAWKGQAHGGLSALLLDQAMGMCASQAFGPTVKTVDSWQKFRKSVPVPSIVQVKAVAVEVQDRRIFVRSSIEDGSGTVFVEGGASFLYRKDQKKKAKM